MAEDIVMPRLSDSMEEGTVLSWIKSVGDQVAVGDELVEIETDKANMVFEADAAGTLIEILAAEGDTLAIGEVIARVGEQGEASEQAEPEEKEEEEEEEEDSEEQADEEEEEQGEEADGAAAPEPEASAPAPTASDSKSDGNGRVKASPLARRIAAEQGVDLAALQGSGPGGRIIKADVESAEPGAPEPEPASDGEPAAKPTAAAESPESARGRVETIELTKLQQTVSRRMAESKATAPHFYLQSEIEMSAAVAARAQLKAAAAEAEVVPSINDLVVKACALALREHPRANGAYRDGRWELYSRVNVGIAVAAAEALVVPTIFDADLKGLGQIATEARALAAKVKEQTITPPELGGATFTVSNLGMFGITNFHPVINSPQAAILAVGAIREAAVVADGELATAKLMGVTLACDHRILYGADGARLLGRVKALLEAPLGLAL